MTHFPARLLLGLVALALPRTGLAQDTGRAGDGDRSTLVQVDLASIPALGRTIALDLRNVGMDIALETIARKAELQLTYSRELLPAGRKVSLIGRRIEVDDALRSVLRDAGLDILALSSGQVVVVRKTQAHIRVQGGLVGRITDAKTQVAMPGVDVFLEHTRWRTTTDTAGWYRLADVDTGAYTLTARRLGYAKRSAPVAVRDGHTDTVNVRLEPVAAKLDELVTTATGQQRRRDLGNAITTIRADSVMRSAPIRNLTDLLAHRVPGLSVQHSSGAPGDPARMRLRGISSVMRGNDPVVIVDGVRVYSAQSEVRSGNLTNALLPSDGQPVAAPSPLDQIDPNIIEKVEVFKGPSAATLYGADAANGVIVITTKRGKPGPARWDARVEMGRTTPAGAYPVGYYRWGHLPTGEVRVCALSYLQCEPDSLVTYQALNDPKMTILGQGRRAAFTLTASGGSQALTYRVTGSYGDETGLLKLPDFEVERFRTNLNREPPDWMRRPWELRTWSVTSSVTALLGRTADVTLSTNLSRSEQQRTDLENQQAALARTYVDRASGTYREAAIEQTVNPADPKYFLLFSGTPLTNYYTRTTASTVKFTTGLDAKWLPRPWFNATAQAGLDVIPRDDERFLPAGLLSPTDSGLLVRGTGRSLVSTFGLQGTLRRPMRWGFAFETSVGANMVATNTNDLVSSAVGLVPGTSSLSGATHFTATDSRVSTSVFGWYVEPRITSQRFSLSTGLRLDGGSAYGTRLTRTGGGLFGGLLGLPKLNGSWVISEEPWFPFTSLFTSLRLRGAYGQSQVQPGAADRLRLYTRRVSGAGDELEIDRPGNSDLRPERSTEFEGGFDADLWDSRLSLEFTGYRKLQVDALMPVTLPGSVHGGGTIIQNIGNIRNTGIDVTATLTPVQTSLLTWSATVNFNRNANTLTKLGSGVEPNPQAGIVAGYPVGGHWARPILGFADRNGDGVITPGEVQIGDSLVFMGRLLPAYTTALFTNVALLGGTFRVTAGFSYDAGATQVDQTARRNWVLSRALVDPTTPLMEQAAAVVNDSTDYGLTQDVSTMRFNSLAVTYHAPPSLARLLRAQQVEVSVQGANLGLHSTYRGKDPDVTAWSPTERIIDTGQIAVPRTWQLMLALQF